MPVTTGVPQGSVLGPLLFLLYTADIPVIAEKHNFGVHCYADDGQLYVSDKAAHAQNLVSRVTACIEEIDEWMSSNRLNADKTQFIWLGSRQQLQKIGVNTVHLGADAVNFQTTVGNLGVTIDSQLTMTAHVQCICRTSFNQRRGRCQELPPPSRGLRSYPRLSRKSWRSNWSPTWSPTTYSPGSNLVSDAATQLRRRSFACFRIFMPPSIMAGSCSLLYWMSVPPSTRWITTSYWSGSLRLSVLQAGHSNGSVRFCHPALIPSVSETLHRRHHRSVTGSLKVQFLGLCCISSIQRTSSAWSGRLGSPCSSMLMIPSSMATACPWMLKTYQFASLRL